MNLRHLLIVVLQVAVLEEDQIVVFVRFNAVFAEGVCALVARSLDLLSFVVRLLTVADATA